MASAQGSNHGGTGGHGLPVTIDSINAGLTCAEILGKYNQGDAFFTKDALQRVLSQLDDLKAGKLKDNKMYIPNIKGFEVEIDLQPGTAIFIDGRCHHGDRREGPYIYYRSLQRMADYADMPDFGRQKAFLSFAVLYPPPGLGPFPVPSVTFKELSEAFNERAQTWDTSEHHQQLQKHLEAHPAVLHNVKKIVAFACGTMATGATIIQRTVLQHVMVLGLQKIITKIQATAPTSPSKLPPPDTEESKGKAVDTEESKGKAVDTRPQLIAQDPAYWPVDKQMLAAANITVMDDPRALLEVTNDSVVVSIDANAPIEHIIIDLARPAAIIWSGLMHGPHVRPTNVPLGWPIIKASRFHEVLRDEYTELKLQPNNDLRNMVLYVRKEVSK
ncbi:hypothetical protein GGR54DRAFT_542850 [Hypoxylon sp. NC1633]|nr:hypothetical protein GGR54DRAFT_542850 [Hypoxylon sp. NC1633]